MKGKRVTKIRRMLAVLMMLSIVLAEAGVVRAYNSSDEPISTAAVSVENLLYERTFDVTSDNVNLYQNVALFRYGEEASDVLDYVPVAMYLNGTGEYLSLSISARKGDYVLTDGRLTTDGAEQFVLIKADNWRENYLSYYIYHPQTELYMALDRENQLYAYGKIKPENTFVFKQTGYTDVGLLTTLDGYQQLSEENKKRVLDVYGGVGARSLFRWGGNDPQNSLANQLNATVKDIYAKKDTTTAEEQAQAMLDGMTLPVYSNQTNWYGLPEIPGTLGLKTKLSEGIEGTYDFWRGTMLEGKRYTFSIIDDYGTHTMDVYIQNDPVAQTNGNNLLEAIKQIPFPVRRNIRTIKVRLDEANSYNCGTNDLYMRLTWSPSVNDIAQYIMHEFGHSMDYSYNVNGSGSWQSAIDADVLKVSDYGATNGYEDFAEFSRLYFQRYGDYNGMYALRQLYPNRYRVYTDALYAAQYEDIYEKYLYLPETEQKSLYTGTIARFTFDDVETGLRSGTAIAKPTGNVVLDDSGKSGKSLKLDGTGSNFLKVWKNDNTSLLSGYDEFTISYYSKPEKANASWPVFLAPNETTQTHLQERYIGVLDAKNEIAVERYNSYGERSEALKATGISNTQWRHVVLVVEKGQTMLYVDGEKKASVASKEAVQDILGKHSIFQIGKGNWEQGEFYQGLIDEMTIYGRALTEKEVLGENKKGSVAQFTFDNETDGFNGSGARASKKGTYELRNDSVSGKSLYLNGNGYVDITKENGTPLLTDCEEMTISYYSKSEKENGQWTFFLSPNTNAQEWGKEKYIGILDNTANIIVERYNNNGGCPGSIDAAYSKENQWKHVIAVFENGMTTLYVDGERVSYVRSEYALPQITGNNSVLQVGKGNWGNNGEYFKGYIDELTIWDTALSKEEVYAAINHQGNPNNPETPKSEAVYKFDFEENLKATVGNVNGTAKTYKLSGDYAGNVVYGEGVNGKAVKLGDYGVKLNTQAIGEQYTFAFWLKPNAVIANYSPLFALGIGVENGSEDWIALSGNEAGSLRLWSNDKIGGTTSWTGIDANITYEVDEWQQYILSVDRGAVVLYKDGVQVAAGNLSPTAYNRPSSDICLGVNAWDEIANVWVDNVAVYNRALTAKEAVELYESEIPAKVVVDKTALQKAIQNAVNASDKDSYTTNSWKAYETALTKAKEVNADANATQESVDVAVKALTNAQSGLEKKPDEPEPPTPKRPFVDVTREDGSWYYDEVYYNFDKGIIQGVDETHFEPLSKVVRGQFAIMLYRLERTPEVTYTDNFADVKASDWHAKAVMWASGARVVTGYTDGSRRFGPADPILREQMAVMMYRYAKEFKGYDVSGSSDYSRFTDAASVSDYAKEAVAWAVGTGIITGKDLDQNGTPESIEPQGEASRAECAIIFKRFLDKYES